MKYCLRNLNLDLPLVNTKTQKLHSKRKNSHGLRQANQTYYLQASPHYLRLAYGWSFTFIYQVRVRKSQSTNATLIYTWPQASSNSWLCQYYSTAYWQNSRSILFCSQVSGNQQCAVAPQDATTERNWLREISSIFLSIPRSIVDSLWYQGGRNKQYPYVDHNSTRTAASFENTYKASVTIVLAQFSDYNCRFSSGPIFKIIGLFRIQIEILL